MLTRRTTFRLYPSKTQIDKLDWARRMHCTLYNAAIADRRDMYKRWGISVDYFGQQNCLPDCKKEWPEYTELGSHTLQATLKRVDFAYQRFFKGLGGYPKFKASRHYAGWTYPDKQSWQAHTAGLHGILELRDLGLKVKMRGQARTWGMPTTCTVFCRNGRWYASVTVKCEPVRQTGPGVIGIDLGCKDAVTFSTGEKIAKPEFIAIGEQSVKRASKRLRRKRAPNRKKRIKGSRRWKQGRKQVSKLQRKVTRQREDWLHKLTTDIVSGYSLVGGEHLNVKGMTRKAKKGSQRKRQKSGLNRSILSVGFGMMGGMLDYKLAEAGGFYIESPTRQLKPTQRCAVCWELTPKTLSDRVHVCQHCGHTEDRDVNSAQVNEIYAKGQELSSSRRGGTATERVTAKQVASLKRAKLSTKEDGNPVPLRAG